MWLKKPSKGDPYGLLGIEWNLAGDDDPDGCLFSPETEMAINEMRAAGIDRSGYRKARKRMPNGELPRLDCEYWTAPEVHEPQPTRATHFRPDDESHLYLGDCGQ